jgi:hypothetical protein
VQKIVCSCTSLLGGQRIVLIETQILAYMTIDLVRLSSHAYVTFCTHALYDGSPAMPVDVSIDGGSRITFVVLTGNVSPADLQGVRDQIGGAADHTPRLFIDASAARLNVSGADIRALAARDPHLFCRIAVYAPDPAAFGLARMYEQVSGDRRHVSVFSDREQALAWLRAA